MTEEFPAQANERDRWLVARRGARNVVDPRRPYAFVVEQERADSGEVVRGATIFLTNRECPWRCLMCDLWKNTLTETVPVGAIPGQIDWALIQCGAAVTPAPLAPTTPRLSTLPGGTEARSETEDRQVPCPALRQIKLYNSGSFFDPRAIPPEDLPAIAERVRGFGRVIVECHPALVSETAVKFRDLLGGAKLEVAMGLETVHPEVLPRLNKRMTLGQFSRSASFLRENDIALRVFILVKPPFLDEASALHWAERSIDFAFDCGATVASLIPTRPGNGALEALARRGDFSPPKLTTLEAALDYGVSLKRGRVFADLWDLDQFSNCPVCLGPRKERLERINLSQLAEAPVDCAKCMTG